MSNPTTPSPEGTYILLLTFRAFALLSGILFSLPLQSPTSLILHTTTLLLLAAECLAARRSTTTTSNPRQKQLWTAASLALYAATWLALAGCFLAPREIWSTADDDGFPTFPRHDRDPGSRILYLPDVLAAVTSAATFFTLPALRIRRWRSLPREEGVFAGDGDAVPAAAVYGDHRDWCHDEDGDGGDETSGPLAATFRARQEEEGGCWGSGKDDDSVVTLV